MFRRFILPLAPLVLLAACASPGTDLDLGDRSPYGLFLAGQGALNDGRGADAAAYFAQAEDQGVDLDLIGEQAFMATLLSGDISTAASLAPVSEDVPDATRRMGRLVVGVEALALGRGKDAHEIITPEGIGYPHRSASALLAPWAAAMAGDRESALIKPEIRGDRVVDYFGQLGQAQLYERYRMFDQAETNYKTLLSTNNVADLVTLAYGSFLERRGRKADAVTLYGEAVARVPSDQALMMAYERARAGRTPPPLPDLKQGAAQALVAPAANFMGARQNQLALAYLRLSLRLDPTRNDTWLMAGDLMQSSGDIDGARVAYGRPRPGTAEYASAQAKLAWSYQTAKDSETALRMATAAAASGDREARINLADLLRANEKFAESAAVLDAVLKDEASPDWRLLYARGIARERSGNWPGAEADLTAALAAQPDESEILNYLGYSWIDRGIKLDEAMAMVQRAVATNPRSGAMIDSLGWAYYRLGDYPKAVAKLEEAVEIDAGDPEINNHLGDAYWRIGRRIEAVFQWKRVLTLDPPANIKADAEAKIEKGLPDPAPVAPTKVAGN